VNRGFAVLLPDDLFSAILLNSWQSGNPSERIGVSFPGINELLFPA